MGSQIQQGIQFLRIDLHSAFWTTVRSQTRKVVLAAWAAKTLVGEWCRVMLMQ
jgi:hypothetical protein